MLEPVQTHPIPESGFASASASASAPAPTRPHARLPRVDSRTLLAGGRERVIQHGAEEYRLRLTRNDKLILTK